ncbi:MAG: hypothetical protein SGARI_001007 [Bacillariaceae sp.]
MDYQTIAVELMNQMLEPMCADMNNSSFTLDPATSSEVIYDEEFVDAMTQEPSCRQTCVDDSDSFFLSVTGLQDTRPGAQGQYNTLLWGDVVTDDIVNNVVASFGDYQPANDTVRQCVMNYEQFEEGTRFYDVAYNANKSTYQFAPGINTGDNRQCEIQLGSTGAYYDNNTDSVNSLCNPASPGVQYNEFLLDGSYSALFSYCGYDWSTGTPATITANGVSTPMEATNNPYWDFIRGGAYGCYGSMMVAGCQNKYSQSGTNTDSCYCMTQNTQGSQLDGLRCPLYGPVFYMNLKIVWILGGVEYMKSMPGSRVPCLNNGSTDQCSNMCNQTQIEDFNECKGIYY